MLVINAPVFNFSCIENIFASSLTGRILLTSRLFLLFFGILSCLHMLWSVLVINKLVCMLKIVISVALCRLSCCRWVCLHPTSDLFIVLWYMTSSSMFVTSNGDNKNIVLCVYSFIWRGEMTKLSPWNFRLLPIQCTRTNSFWTKPLYKHTYKLFTRTPTFVGRKSLHVMFG